MSGESGVEFLKQQLIENNDSRINAMTRGFKLRGYSSLLFAPTQKLSLEESINRRIDAYSKLFSRQEINPLSITRYVIDDLFYAFNAYISKRDIHILMHIPRYCGGFGLLEPIPGRGIWHNKQVGINKPNIDIRMLMRDIAKQNGFLSENAILAEVKILTENKTQEKLVGKLVSVHSLPFYNMNDSEIKVLIEQPMFGEGLFNITGVKPGDGELTLSSLTEPNISMIKNPKNEWYVTKNGNRRWDDGPNSYIISTSQYDFIKTSKLSNSVLDLLLKNKVSPLLNEPTINRLYGESNSYVRQVAISLINYTSIKRLDLTSFLHIYGLVIKMLLFKDNM